MESKLKKFCMKLVHNKKNGQITASIPKKSFDKVVRGSLKSYKKMFLKGDINFE